MLSVYDKTNDLMIYTSYGNIDDFYNKYIKNDKFTKTTHRDNDVSSIY